MPKGRRPLALLALLAASGSHGLSRDKVTALLWPESDAERSRNSLSQVLTSLRRDLGVDDLVLGNTEIRLNADAITSDVEDFEARVAHGDVERAVAIQPGPFLDGFYLTDAPEFERWVEEQRARLNEQQRDALEKLASDADRRGDRAGSVAWWRRLAALDPTSARAAAGLMEALSASGDGAAALRHFQVYTALLQQELHAEPDAAVVRLAGRLRRGDGVTRDGLRAAPTSTATGVSTAAIVPNTVPAIATERTPPRFRPRIGMNRIYTIAAITLLVIAVTVLRAAAIGPFATLLSAGRLGPNELVLVADFETAGPDSALGGPLAQMMRSGLSQSRVIEIVPLSRVADAVGRMARADHPRVELSLAREIAQREGIKAVVAGSLAPFSGGGYILSTRLILASTGDELASFQEPANGPTEVVAAVDRLSRRLRERIGESLKSIRADPPLAEVTTASLNALEKYTEAMQANAVRDFPRAIALLEEAIGFDSNFAMAYRQMVVSNNTSAYARIGIGGGQISQSARMQTMTQRAYQLRDRLPERERLQTIALYYGAVGDVAKARATFETLLTKYPRTAGAANNYAVSFLMNGREFARAESVFATVIATDTSVVFPFANIVNTQIAQGKLTDARQSVERLVRQFPKKSQGIRSRSELQYALGHVDSSETLLRDLVSSGSQEDSLYTRNMLTAYNLLRGQISNVRSELKAARALDTATGGQSLPLQDSMTVAQIHLAFFNHREVAVRMLDRALRETPRESILEARDRPYLRAASLYALAGRPDKARTLLARYDRDVKDAVQRRNDERDRLWATAHIASAERRASVAIAEFRNADRLPGFPFQQCTVCVDPDVGHAFDRAGMPDSAIAAFEHFVDAPSLRRVVADAWNLHWILRRLGELYEARGDTAAAAKYYHEFIALWKDADPELLPVVKDVRRRLTRLEDSQRTRRD